MLPNPLEEIARKLDEYNKRLSHLERLEVGGAWTLIEDVNLLVATEPIDIQNIPSAHKHLFILMYCRVTTAVTRAAIVLRYNGDGGANYDRLLREHDGGGGDRTLANVATTVNFIGDAAGGAAPALAFDTIKVFIPNYANTVNHKSLVSEFSSKIGVGAVADISVGHCAGWWRSAAAINRIQLFATGASLFEIGTRVSLYGIG